MTKPEVPPKAPDVQVKVLLDFYGKPGEIHKEGETITLSADEASVLIASGKVAVDTEPHTAADKQVIKDEQAAEKRNKP